MVLSIIHEKEFYTLYRDSDTDEEVYYIKKLTDPQEIKKADEIATEFKKKFMVVNLLHLKKEFQQYKKWIKEAADKKGLNSENFPALLTHVLSKVCTSLGITPFMLDPDIEDLQVFGYDKPVLVTLPEYGSCITNVFFNEEKKEIESIIENLLRGHNVVMSFSNPIVDISLSDGSRLNATYPPISPGGPTISIRKFKEMPITVSDLINKGQLTVDAAALLWMYMSGLQTVPINMVVAGGVGSGKTSLLNLLTLFIPNEEVLLTIEETREVSPQTQNVITLVSRPHGLESTGRITQDDLLRASLRKNPDRIIIGEMRGEEAASLFSAMNVGRKCLTTIHANSSEEVITRLSNPPMNVPRELIGLLDVVILMVRIIDEGKIKRRILQISEILQEEDNKYKINHIYRWDSPTDTLKKINEPMKIKKIAEYLGVDENKVVEDLKERENILSSISKKSLPISEIKKILEKHNKEARNKIRKN